MRGPAMPDLMLPTFCHTLRSIYTTPIKGTIDSKELQLNCLGLF